MSPHLVRLPGSPMPYVHRLVPLGLLVFTMLTSLSSFGQTPATDEQGAVSQLLARAHNAVVTITVRGRDGRREGLGTGFVISPDGKIATNLHVIGEARPIRVAMRSGRLLPVTAIHASDRALDLAILRVDASDLPSLPLAQSPAKQGDPIVVLGNPMGLRDSVVRGIVSGRRQVDRRNMLQIAVPIEQGNSGGPVLNAEGQVVGIVTMKSVVTANLGFAVDVADLRTLQASPNPIPMSQWQTIGQLATDRWEPIGGGQWQQRSGQIHVSRPGDGFGGRTLCLWRKDPPVAPYEVGAWVHLDDEAGAAGLAVLADGGTRHFGFYPSGGKMRLTRFNGPTVLSWQVLYDEPSDAYRPGEWNYLKVRIEIDRLKGYVNDQLVVDHQLPPLAGGRAGLVKFRDTTAQFKQFEIAQQLPNVLPPAEAIAAVAASIRHWSDEADPSAVDLEAAPAELATQLAALRQEQKRLARRAKLFRQVADDLQTAATCRQLREELEKPVGKVSLARAALLVAKLDTPDLDVDAYLNRLEEMAQEIRQTLPDQEADDAARRAALDTYLFQTHGFHGSRTQFYHRANSYLNQVIDDREGLPITLSILYLELGRHIGLPLFGVGLPGHFVVGLPPTEGTSQRPAPAAETPDQQEATSQPTPLLIDVFDRAAPLPLADATAMAQAITGRPLDATDLQPASHRAIVARLLRNLQRLAEADGDNERLRRYLDALVAVEPDEPAHRGQRAVVRFRTDRFQGAIDDLQWFLDTRPEGVDLTAIGRMQQAFRNQQANRPARRAEVAAP